MTGWEFASPAWLGALWLAAVPWLLWRWRRPRAAVVRWGAMRYLQAALERRRAHRRDWIPPLIQSVGVAAMVLAAARPRPVETSQRDGREATRDRQIWVVDRSLSMERRLANGRSIRETAVESARSLLARSSADRSIRLLDWSGAGPHAVLGRPTRQQAVVEQALGAMSPGGGCGTLVSLLKELRDLTHADPGAVVTIWTDRQRSTWRPTDPDDAALCRELWAEIATAARIRLATAEPATDPAEANASVSDLGCLNDWPVVGAPFVVAATVATGSDDPPVERRVELRIDGRLVDVQPLGSANRRTVEFRPQVPVDVAPLRIEATLVPGDLLPLDDTARLVFQPQPTIRVLLATNSTETEFEHPFVAALAPSVREGTLPPIQVERRRFGDWADGPSELYPLVLFDDPPPWGPADVERVAGVLAGGGTVAVWLGESTRPDAMNPALRDLLGEKAPTIVERMGDASNPEAVFDVDASELGHPLLKPFQGNPGAGLEQTKAFAYWRTTAVASDDVALRLGGGDPAIVSVSAGRGQFVLWTTSIDRRWSTWGVWGHSLVPVLNELLRAAVDRKTPLRSTTAGQPFEFFDSALTTGKSLTLRRDGTAVTPAISFNAAGAAALPNVTGPAWYDAQISDGRSEPFAVNADVADSNLETIAADDWRRDLAVNDVVEFHEMDGLPGGSTTTESNAVLSHIPLIRWLILLAILASAIDAAWRRA